LKWQSDEATRQKEYETYQDWNTIKVNIPKTGKNGPNDLTGSKANPVPVPLIHASIIRD
jgi:hypothetical protein